MTCDSVDSLWTIGHSTRSLAEFVTVLKHYQIEAIADIRRFPGSRRLPQFNAQTLADSLGEVGIDYQLITELGGRRRALPDTVNTVWRNASFRGYADHLSSAEFRTGLDQLCKMAAKLRTAMMCAEILWWRCHRSLVADVLMVAGTQVIHIQDSKHAVEHPYTGPARLHRGALTYETSKGTLLNHRERSDDGS